MWALMCSCWTVDPLKRPSIEEVFGQLLFLAQARQQKSDAAERRKGRQREDIPAILPKLDVPHSPTPPPHAEVQSASDGVAVKFEASEALIKYSPRNAGDVAVTSHHRFPDIEMRMASGSQPLVRAMQRVAISRDTETTNVEGGMAKGIKNDLRHSIFGKRLRSGWNRLFKRR